jgi:hypothetical protein
VAKERRQQRHYVESKLRRVLERMGVDFDAVKAAYEAEPGQRRGRGQVPSEREIAAVEEFMRTGDLGRVQSTLGIRSPQTAHAVVARVVAFKARGGGAERRRVDERPPLEADGK